MEDIIRESDAYMVNTKFGEVTIENNSKQNPDLWEIVDVSDLNLKKCKLDSYFKNKALGLLVNAYAVDKTEDFDIIRALVEKTLDGTIDLHGDIDTIEDRLSEAMHPVMESVA